MNKILLSTLIMLATFIFVPAQAKITLIGHVPFSGDVTDVWVYNDSVSSKEYALVGTFNSIRIIDVTIAELPQPVKQINVPGFDFKIWKNYLYTVTGAPGENQGVILDLTNPLDPTIEANFNSAHNIYIGSNGYLFAEVPGLRIYNLNNDPLSPELVYDSKDEEGHDATLIGNRLYDFHGRAGTNIYDIQFGDSVALTLVGSIKDSTISYHHSGWPSEDGNTLFICDELAQNPFPDVTAWNISNPSNPVKVGEFIDTNAIIHNLYVFGDYAYTSYYSSGFRVLDVSQPSDITIAADYDTNPFSGDGFTGAFGVYHNAKTGFTYVSDGTGLYVFKFEISVVNVTSDKVLSFDLSQNYPNPFNPSTVIKYNVHEPSEVSVKISSVLGEEIKTLVDEFQSQGEKSVVWDGTNSNGEKAAQGVYLYTLRSGEHVRTMKMVMLK